LLNPKAIYTATPRFPAVGVQFDLDEHRAIFVGARVFTARMAFRVHLRIKHNHIASNGSVDVRQRRGNLDGLTKSHQRKISSLRVRVVGEIVHRMPQATSPPIQGTRFSQTGNDFFLSTSQTPLYSITALSQWLPLTSTTLTNRKEITQLRRQKEIGRYCAIRARTLMQLVLDCTGQLNFRQRT